MLLARLWTTVGHPRRPPTTVQIFRRARRYRDEGRFEEAAELVARGLTIDPDSVVGLLLAGSLSTVFRDVEGARTAFARVLTVDRTHPRALLGLARVALEEGDTAGCRSLLERALDRYPDFPEASALLDAVTGVAVAPTPPRPRGLPTINVDRLRMPAESRGLLLARGDGTVVLAHPRDRRTDELAASTGRVWRLATGALARAGLGPLRRALIEKTFEVTALRTEDDLVLCLAFPRAVASAAALAHLERVWAHCRAELEAAVV